MCDLKKQGSCLKSKKRENLEKKRHSIGMNKRRALVGPAEKALVCSKKSVLLLWNTLLKCR